MIAHLRGTASKIAPGELMVDVQGVGYRVLVPLNVWEDLKDGADQSLWISTYVREDRLELFGFPDRLGRTLFEELIDKPGIGPRLGLELCAVPRQLLAQAITQQDAGMLTTIKGIGKKKAEKLLLDLKGLRERHPDMFVIKGAKGEAAPTIDQDAIAALSALGYDMPTIINALKDLPDDIESAEERVTAALRSL